MDTIDGLVLTLVTKHRFSDRSARAALRAQFKCEYCSVDMIGSVEAYYTNFHLDHVIPAARGGATSLENFALSCRTCNLLKGNWDPTVVAGDRAAREELVALARRYVQQQRARRLRELAGLRQIVAEVTDL